MTKDYTIFKIENYILKLTGLFNYDKSFFEKALNSGYQELKYNDSDLEGFKDYFYPDFRKHFFSNDLIRHHILILKANKNPILNLCKFNKECNVKVIESRLDLFDEGFGLFTLSIEIQTEIVSLSKFSDAAFLIRNFETPILNSIYRKWHEYIENEILLGTITKGNSIKVDEYSGSKYKLYMVLDIPELTEKAMMKSLLFDLGTLSTIGSSIGNNYDSMNKEFIDKLIQNNSISVYHNYEALALLDTFTVVGNKLLDFDYKKEVYSSIYYCIFMYCLFIKFTLFKYSFEITTLDEDRRDNFRHFLEKYYYHYISYNFLPNEIYNKIKIALDIDKELKFIDEKIVAIGQKIQEKQQDRTNKILAIVTVLTSVSSIEPIYDYLIKAQKAVGWKNEIYWSTVISVLIVFFGGIVFYIFGRNILLWFNLKKDVIFKKKN